MCGNIFQKYTDNLANVIQSKNKDYGDSFTKSVYKYNRNEHLITNNELKENDESLEDTLLDMAGYSMLALRYLKEHKDENYRG